MLKFPELMAQSDLLYWRTMQRWSVHSAKQVITISHSAAKDIEHFYHVPPHKIQVIYPACSPHFCPVSQGEIEYVRQKYHLPQEYILHVSRIDRLKNLTTLVKVFDRLRKSGVYSGKLVLVGAVYKKTPDLDLIPTIQQLGLEKEVILTGLIADEDLPAVFSGACLKVFVPHNEGFGLVVLEAMSCGTPVVAYRAGGAVAEVVGEAGIITESNDIDTLTEAVGRVVSDRELQVEMRKKGLAQAQKFNRYETARQTLAVYHAVSGK